MHILSITRASLSTGKETTMRLSNAFQKLFPSNLIKLISTIIGALLIGRKESLTMLLTTTKMQFRGTQSISKLITTGHFVGIS
jgi:hypothetical protein